ncbi:MAG: hypothetical protein OXC00_03680 [Acidimicrobiaceae bacterium]|nr:hypothetical protein [Acidimicrobiaceae bacterium]
MLSGPGLLRRGPLLLLAAALVALAVASFQDTRPASADHETAAVWSATLTVNDMGGARYGCDNSRTGEECSAALTDDDFTYDGASYEVTAVNVRRGTLSVTLSKDIPTEMNVLSLSVGGVRLELADNSAASLDAASWRDTGLSWSEGDRVEFELGRFFAPSGVALSTETLAVTEGGSGTFTVALSADPGADTTVTLVKVQYYLDPDYGAAGHDWDTGAASVSPETLTFTSGRRGTWATPQDVTVSGTQDADSRPEQLIILVLVQTSAASGNENPVYEPVGGSDSSVTGVYVTVADDDPSGGL